MVRQWQESFYEGRTSESVFDTLPDFQLMAQAYGIKNYKFDNPETIEKDLEVSSGGCTNVYRGRYFS